MRLIGFILVAGFVPMMLGIAALLHGYAEWLKNRRLGLRGFEVIKPGITDTKHP